MSMARIPTLVGREEAIEVYFPSLCFGACLDAKSGEEVCGGGVFDFFYI